MRDEVCFLCNSPGELHNVYKISLCEYCLSLSLGYDIMTSINFRIMLELKRLNDTRDKTTKLEAENRQLRERLDREIRSRL